MTWNFSKPNLKSAKEDNVKGICAMGNCSNKLGDPPACGFGSIKVCDVCRKGIDEMLEKVYQENNKAMIEQMENLFEVKYYGGKL